jgi:choline dehydrogenase
VRDEDQEQPVASAGDEPSELRGAIDDLSAVGVDSDLGEAHRQRYRGTRVTSARRAIGRAIGGSAVELVDYVVVGAGSAGCVLAARLSEDASVRVLLIEAGPTDRHPFVRIPAAFPRLFGSRRDWDFHTTPQDALRGRRVYWPRGRVIGGSGSINAMMWIRGMAADYARWETIAGPDWSYGAVLERFRRLENTEASADSDAFGHDGPMAVRELRDPNPLTLAWLDAAREVGIAANEARNAGSEDGVATPLVTQRNGRRESTADAYLNAARARPNLTIWTDASAERLVVRDGRGDVVTVRRGRTVVVVEARRAVVLCAGAIGTPELLMRSGIGPGAMVQRAGVAVVADAPAIGQHLVDHLCTGFALEVSSHVSLGGAQRPAAFAKYLLGRKGLLTSNIAEGYGFVRSDPELVDPDLELLFVPGLFIDEGRTIPTRHGITLAAVLLQPKSEGELRLVVGTDRPALEIDPRYLSDTAGDDARALAQGVRRCLEIVRAAPLASIAGAFVQPPAARDEALIDDAVHGFAQTLYHPAGTCAMGLDSGAAVDAELRLRAVDGVRIADASVIPHLIRGHTNAPTVMIAERAAELLRASGA